MSYIHEITEETIDKMKNRYYRGNREIKVGDKLIYGFVNGRKEGDEEINLELKPFVLDEYFFYELYELKNN